MFGHPPDMELWPLLPPSPRPILLIKRPCLWFSSSSLINSSCLFRSISLTILPKFHDCCFSIPSPLVQKRSSDPEIGRAFLAFSMMKAFWVLWNMLCFPCPYNHILVRSIAIFFWDLSKMCVFVWWKRQTCIQGTPIFVYKKLVRLHSTTAPALLFHQDNLRRVLPVTSYTCVLQYTCLRPKD